MTHHTEKKSSFLPLIVALVVIAVIIAAVAMTGPGENSKKITLPSASQEVVTIPAAPDGGGATPQDI